MAIKTASVTLAGVGDLSVSSARVRSTTVTVDGVGDLAVSGRRAPILDLTGVGDLAINARSYPWFNLTGEGDLSVTASRVRSGSVTYQGEADLEGTAVRVRSASVTVDGVGDLDAWARAILTSAAQHIHRTDATYALQQNADVTLPLERTVEGAVYEEGRERQLGRSGTGDS